MRNVVIPKKFEIQFRHTSDDRYTGILLIDGREMGVGTPKSLDEITAFLMPQIPLRLPLKGDTDHDDYQART